MESMHIWHFRTTRLAEYDPWFTMSSIMCGHLSTRVDSGAVLLLTRSIHSHILQVERLFMSRRLTRYIINALSRYSSMQACPLWVATNIFPKFSAYNCILIHAVQTAESR